MAVRTVSITGEKTSASRERFNKDYGYRTLGGSPTLARVTRPSGYPENKNATLMDLLRPDALVGAARITEQRRESDMEWEE